MINLKAVEGLWIMFSLPNFDLLLFYLMERTASATYNILQANWVVLVDFLINVRKKLSLCKLLYFLFFRWNMLHLSRKQLMKFLFWFWHRKKRYPFIFLHILLYHSYKISHHLLNALELEYASFYYCRKWSPKMFVVKNWYSI